MKGENSRKFKSLRVVEALPLSRYSPEGGEEFLKSMRGVTIVHIGSTDESGIEGGGLIIDYIPAGKRKLRRVIFAFNESGLWLRWEGRPNPINPPKRFTNIAR